MCQPTAHVPDWTLWNRTLFVCGAPADDFRRSNWLCCRIRLLRGMLCIVDTTDHKRYRWHGKNVVRSWKCFYHHGVSNVPRTSHCRFVTNAFKLFSSPSKARGTFCGKAKSQNKHFWMQMKISGKGCKLVPRAFLRQGGAGGETRAFSSVCYSC